MNKELIEKLSAIREDLVALQAQVGDAKKLAEFAEHRSVPLRLNYRELWPYLSGTQKSNATWLIIFEGFYIGDTQQRIAYAVEKGVPLMLADLDDIAKKLENNA